MQRKAVTIEQTHGAMFYFKARPLLSDYEVIQIQHQHVKWKSTMSAMLQSEVLPNNPDWKRKWEWSEGPCTWSRNGREQASNLDELLGLDRLPLYNFLKLIHY